MLLGQVSWLDCFVFLVFLAPQLISQVGFFTTLFCGLSALPFLLVKLPLGFIHDRLVLPKSRRSPFVQQASWFEDCVVRCVRYAFRYIPASTGRVFFSKAVSLPFLKFRMLRHGYFRCPIHWHELDKRDFKGIWIITDKHQEPDIVVYYAHGGGFSMGSSYFYLEFLLAFTYLLKASGFRNPAILALEYTLVPDSSYPTQIHQALAAYRYILSITRDPSKVCVSGDSAGGSIILSMLLHLATAGAASEHTLPVQSLETRIPGMAVLISPWVTLVSPLDTNTQSDYLDATSLHLYARQYADKIPVSDALISPGNCKDVQLWQRATPRRGFLVMYGAEEVFAPEIKKWLGLMKQSGLLCDSQEERGGIHAWPVASLFLSSTKLERQKGLKAIVEHIRDRMG